MVKISIIIPCYNHGKFIDETVDSCLKQSYKDFEIIIVNDGSNDPYTQNKLKNYKKDKTRVINISQSGPSTARNTGIRNSKGEYILTLDADDKIHENYIEKGIEILDSNQDIGIVYGKAKYFGRRNSVWELPEFSLELMLKRNLIFSAALFRKSDWKAVKGFDEDIIHGKEDYDFWLSIIELGKKVYRIPEIMFFYRKHFVSKNSFSKRIKRINEIKRDEYILRKHKKIYGEHPDALIDMITELKLKQFEEKEKLLRKRLTKFLQRIFRIK